MTGWVYAFETPSMPGFLKIGATRRSPVERLEEANASDTWRPPHPYVVACAAEVADPFACERAVHALLGARRINPRNEFFDVTVDEARTVFALLSPKAAHAPNLTPLVAAPVAAPVAVPVAARARVAVTAEEKLRAWVESNYTHVPLREKDTGSKLEALHTAYASAAPPVHQKFLGKTTFGKMLCAVYPGIGPHRGSAGETGIFLLRRSSA